MYSFLFYAEKKRLWLVGWLVGVCVYVFQLEFELLEFFDNKLVLFCLVFGVGSFFIHSFCSFDSALISMTLCVCVCMCLCASKCVCIFFIWFLFWFVTWVSLARSLPLSFIFCCC